MMMISMMTHAAAAAVATTVRGTETSECGSGSEHEWWRHAVTYFSNLNVHRLG